VTVLWTSGINTLKAINQ